MKCLLTVLLFSISTCLFGQTKKELEVKVSALQSELDSAYIVLDSYHIMYNAIQEKVLNHDFDPNEMGEILDSLQSNQDSIVFGLMTRTKSLSESISIMAYNVDSLMALTNSQKIEIAELKIQIDELLIPHKSLTNEQVSALEKIKMLFDAEILTRKEFEDRKIQILYSPSGK